MVKMEARIRAALQFSPRSSIHQNNDLGNVMYCQVPKRRITGIMVIVSTCKRCQEDPPFADGTGLGRALDCEWPPAELLYRD